MIHVALLLLLKLVISATLNALVRLFYHPGWVCRSAYNHGFQDGLVLGLLPDALILSAIAAYYLRRKPPTDAPVPLPRDAA